MLTSLAHLLTYERTCVFIGACECGTRVYSIRTVPGHGRVFFVRCCAAAYSLPGRGVRSDFILELVHYFFSDVYMRYGVWLGQPKQCILYVYVCMYGGRHVQPVRCTSRREYVYACVVQYIWPGQPGRRA